MRAQTAKGELISRLLHAGSSAHRIVAPTLEAAFFRGRCNITRSAVELGVRRNTLQRWLAENVLVARTFRRVKREIGSSAGQQSRARALPGAPAIKRRDRRRVCYLCGEKTSQTGKLEQPVVAPDPLGGVRTVLEACLDCVYERAFTDELELSRAAAE